MAIVLVSTLAFSGVTSLRERERDAAPPRPSLGTRRWIVAGVTLAAVALHLWSWLRLRPVVPPNARAGSVLSGGPGDGLWLMLVVLAPWFCMQLVNVWLACFCARNVKQAALIGSLLLAVWIGTAVLGGVLTRCPAGFVCTGG